MAVKKLKKLSENDLSVLVLPINQRTVSFDFTSLLLRSILCTLNALLFLGLTSYNNCVIHASGNTKMCGYINV